MMLWGREVGACDCGVGTGSCSVGAAGSRRPRGGSQRCYVAGVGSRWCGGGEAMLWCFVWTVVFWRDL